MQNQDDRKFSERNEDEGMGNADIKYGDSLIYLQHRKSGMWLSYQTFETKKRGVGRVEEKKVTSFRTFALCTTFLNRTNKRKVCSTCTFWFLSCSNPVFILNMLGIGLVE